MPSRGPQFPLVNQDHFQRAEPYGQNGLTLTHTSQRGEYSVEHVFHHTSPTSGHGIVRVKHPSFASRNPWDAKDTDHEGNTEQGTVAHLKYDLEQLPRATTMRPQPLTHTEYIDVHDSHQGKGLTGLMHDTLRRAHPGAPNIASNELTTYGASWRQHLAKSLRDPGMGQRVGWGGDEGMDRVVLRPGAGVSPGRLHEDEFVAESDNFVAKPRRHRPAREEEPPW